jgi:hypothetical protein
MPTRCSIAAGLLVTSLCLTAFVAIGLGFGAKRAVAEEAREPRQPAAGTYTAWQYQADKERFWCRYNYTNQSGQAGYQFVLYYPDEKRNGVYYFQTPTGRIWACCTRPGAAGYSATAMKWFRQDNAGKWVRRADGDDPSPPDGGPRIGAQGDSRLPATPPPEAFAKLSEADRKAAERFHQLLGEVAIEEGHIVGLDFGGSDLADAALAEVGKVASLQRLYLNGTQITDNGLKHLAGLTSLTHLDVSQTQVTDGGLKHLEKLASLRTLIVRGSQGISAEAVRTARKSNPRLLVTGP